MAVTLWVIFGVVFGVMPMKDQSMMPKLAAGDLLLYYRLDRTPGDREVVVFEKEAKGVVPDGVNTAFSSAASPPVTPALTTLPSKVPSPPFATRKLKDVSGA